MKRDVAVLLVMLAVAMAAGTWLYAGKDKREQNDFSRVRAAFSTLHQHIKKPSRIGLLISGGRGTEFQHGENILYYASLRQHKSPEEIVEDTVLIFRPFNSQPVQNWDSAGYRTAWSFLDAVLHYELLIRK